MHNGGRRIGKPWMTRRSRRITSAQGKGGGDQPVNSGWGVAAGLLLVEGKVRKRLKYSHTTRPAPNTRPDPEITISARSETVEFES